MTLESRLLRGWEQVLDMCRVRPGETVLLLLGTKADPDNLSAATLSAERLDARVIALQLRTPPLTQMTAGPMPYAGQGVLAGNKAAIEAMKHADIIVDFMGLDRGSEQREILDAGTRILLVKEPPEVLLRLIPTPETKRRVLAAAAALSRATRMTVKSEAGTDFEARIGEYPPLIQYGLADEPGRWDHWPSAFVATWPNETSAEGTVVLKPGDTVLPLNHYVRSAVRLSISGGYIRQIEGDFDARYLRDYMSKFNDPEGYAVSHLGWGLDHRAHWTVLGTYGKSEIKGMDSRSFLGNFMFSTGPNLEGGGNRNTPCHLDIPMSDCSVYLDDRVVVESGELRTEFENLQGVSEAAGSRPDREAERPQ